MWKEAKSKLFWWGVGVVTGAALTADLAFARSIDMSKAGVSLWIFLAVGIFIVLLQAIPAIIIILSFVTHFHKSVPVTDKVTEKTKLWKTSDSYAVEENGQES